jgi:hypothetical protein
MCSKQKGGRVVMPSEYYGQDSGRYYPEGAQQLTPSGGAFSPLVARSFGTLFDNNTQMGPNLSPFPGALPASVEHKPPQIGGGRRRKMRKTRRRNSNKKRSVRRH